MTRPTKLNVMIARMAYTGYECSGLVNWLLTTSTYLNSHPAVGEVYHVPVERVAPVARARNKAAAAALQHSADVLVMVDADIIPHPDFLPRALKQFEAARRTGRGAGIVAAPAVCDDGKSNILHWVQPEAGGFRYVGPPILERLGAREAGYLSGVGEAAAAGTGCIAIDTRVFGLVERPWFALEYGDEDEEEVSTGEDVYFTRSATEQGVPLWILWDCWCGHRKEVTLAKPVPVYAASVPHHYREILDLSQRASG